MLLWNLKPITHLTPKCPFKGWAIEIIAFSSISIPSFLLASSSYAHQDISNGGNFSQN
jgi:hypothetical protein